MKKVTQESLSKQGNQVDKHDYSKNEETVKYEPIKDTPFTKAWVKDKGWYILLGQYQLTEPVKTEKKLDELYNNEFSIPNWDRLTQLILCLIDSNNKNSITKNQ
jgi:hypothetical protein